MSKDPGNVKIGITFALSLLIPTLWFIFCVNSGADRSGDLVLSNFFLGGSISVWLFLGIGILLFAVTIWLIAATAQPLEQRRLQVGYFSEEGKKLNVRIVIMGLIMGIFLLSMIAGAMIVLTYYGGSDADPSVIYYYYYY